VRLLHLNFKQFGYNDIFHKCPQIPRGEKLPKSGLKLKLKNLLIFETVCKLFTTSNAWTVSRYMTLNFDVEPLIEWNLNK
jgi:hypothetical protein